VAVRLVRVSTKGTGYFFFHIAIERGIDNEDSLGRIVRRGRRADGKRSSANKVLTTMRGLNPNPHT
jgi:hypothetical protein